MVKNIFDFCKEYNHCPSPKSFTDFSVTYIDLPNGYSVMTKTLEDIFQSFYKKNTLGKFKNKSNEELFGVLIYFGFIEMFQLFIETNKDKFSIVDTMDEPYMKNEFFRENSIHHPSLLVYNLNFMYNHDRYQNERNKIQFENDFNQSIFFNLLTKNEKMNRDASGNVSFKTAFKFVLQYIFSCELYMMVREEVLKCRNMYNMKFNIFMREIQYAQKMDTCIPFSEFIKMMEKLFLDSCANHIYNIQETVDNMVFKDLMDYYHLDFEKVREFLNRKDLDSQSYRFHHKKFNVYTKKVKDDKIYFKLFHVVDDWIVDIFVKEFVKYDFNNLNLFSIQKTIQNFFNNVTYQSLLFDSFGDYLERKFVQIPKSSEQDKKNHLPSCFHSFSMRGNQLISRRIKDGFPLDYFNFQNMNLYLWDIICLVKLYRETRERTNRDLTSFLGQWEYYTKKPINMFPKDMGNDISVNSALYAMKCFFIIPQEKKLVDGLSERFAYYFKKYFKNNLREKLKIPKIRLQWIQKKFSMDIFDIEENPIYYYCCRQEPDFFKQILIREKEGMESYLIPGFQQESEKINCAIFLFCALIDKEQERSRCFQFVLFLLFGIQMECKNQKYNVMIQKTLRQLSKQKKIFQPPFHFIPMDEYFFHDYSTVCSILVKKYELFIQYILDVQSMFHNSDSEFEKNVHDHLCLFLEDNFHATLVDVQENISS